jgi:hypothetical protein
VTPCRGINRYPVGKREDNGKIVATEPRLAKTWAARLGVRSVIMVAMPLCNTT